MVFSFAVSLFNCIYNISPESRATEPAPDACTGARYITTFFAGFVSVIYVDVPLPAVAVIVVAEPPTDTEPVSNNSKLKFSESTNSGFSYIIPVPGYNSNGVHIFPQPGQFSI